MHTINRLYTAEFDFQEHESPPTKTLMLATIPRSGSTFFAECLWRTGKLGSPMEYANLPNRSEMFNRLGASDWCDYWDKVKRVRTSPNGVFSYKMFGRNLLEISREHRDLYWKIASTHVVYLTRDDVLGQAISYSRAIKSKAWFAGVKNARGVEYSGAHIAACIRSIHQQRAFWESAFTLADADVLRISYEDFLRNQDATLRRIVSFVGESYCADTELTIPMIEKQRDEISEEWRQRYLEEHGEGSLTEPVVRVSKDYLLIPAA